MKKFIALIGLFLLFAFPLVSAATTYSECAGITFRVDSSSNEDSYTIAITDLNGLNSIPPTDLRFWGDLSGETYDVLSVEYSVGLAPEGSTTLALNAAEPSYAFSFTGSSGVYDLNMVLTDNDAVLVPAVCSIAHSMPAEAVIDATDSDVSNAQVGNSFFYQVSVQNTGFETGKSVSIALNPAFTGFDSNASIYEGFDLDAGLSQSREFLATVNACGTKKIGAIINYNNLNGLPKDSIYLEDIFNVSGADLRVIGIDLNDYNPVDGNIVRITSTIQNNGAVDAGVLFEVSFFDATGLIETKTVNGLNAGDSTTVSIDWDTAGKIGNHDLRVEADSGAAVMECLESNNELTQPVFVNSEGGAYDISITEFEVEPATVDYEGSVSIKAKILVGLANLNGVKVEFAEEGLVFSTETINLTAGEEKEIELTHAMNTAGTRIISINVDADNSFDESNESNNYLEETITVNAPPAQPPAPPGGSSPGSGPGGSTTWSPVKPKISVHLDLNKEVSSTLAKMAGVLEAIGLEEELLNARNLNKELEINTRLYVEKIVIGRSIDYNSTITLTVKNKSAKDFEAMELIVFVPKEIASTAGELTGDFEVLEEDPIISFAIGTLNAGQEKSFSYVIEGKLEENDLDEFVVIGFGSEKETEEDLEGQTGDGGTDDETGEDDGTTGTEDGTDDEGAEDETTGQTGMPTGFLGLGTIGNGLLAIVLIAMIVFGVYSFNIYWQKMEGNSQKKEAKIEKRKL